MRTKDSAPNAAPKRTTAIPHVPGPHPASPPTEAAVPLVTRKIPNFESKIVAAGQDSAQILHTLDTEMALRRAGRRINGQGNVQALRVLSVAMLFTLLLAALGAMSYLQTQFVGHGFKRRPGATNSATANPAPAPSAPDAGRDYQSVPPTR